MNRHDLLTFIDGLTSGAAWPLGADRLKDDEYGRARFDLAEWRAFIQAQPEPPSGWDGLIPALDYEARDAHLWGYKAFCAMAILTAFKPEPAEERHEGDLEIEGSLTSPGDLVVGGGLRIGDDGQLFVGGDLRVEAGDLHLVDGSKVFVLGDVTVNGRLQDASEWCLMAVGGRLRARDAVVTSGELYVGGKLEAPIISATYNHGHAMLLGGVKAAIFHERDHGFSRVWGEVEVGALCLDEMTGVELPKRAETLEALRALVLDPPNDEEGVYDWFDALHERLEGGQPVLKGPGEGPMFDKG